MLGEGEQGEFYMLYRAGTCKSHNMEAGADSSLSLPMQCILDSSGNPKFKKNTDSGNVC